MSLTKPVVILLLKCLRSLERLNAIPLPVPSVMLRHGLVFVSQQLLRVLQVFCIRSRFRANIPKLKADAGRLVRFDKARTKFNIIEGRPFSPRIKAHVGMVPRNAA